MKLIAIREILLSWCLRFLLWLEHILLLFGTLWGKTDKGEKSMFVLLALLSIKEHSLSSLHCSRYHHYQVRQQHLLPASYAQVQKGVFIKCPFSHCVMFFLKRVKKPVMAGLLHVLSSPSFGELRGVRVFAPGCTASK